MEGCKLGEKNRDKVDKLNERIGKIEERLDNFKENQDKIEERLNNVEKIHVMFASVKKDIENINDKIDTSQKQSQENTNAIIKALVSKTQSKKSIKEQFIHAMINAAGYAAVSVLAWIIYQFMQSGGQV